MCILKAGSNESEGPCQPLMIGDIKPRTSRLCSSLGGTQQGQFVFVFLDKVCADDGDESCLDESCAHGFWQQSSIMPQISSCGHPAA